jgi:hypothetical protein
VAKTSAICTDEYRRTDFRLEPEKYRVGVGEQGVLIVEPYKSELLPLWRFRTLEVATESAKALVTNDPNALGDSGKIEVNAG